MAGSILGLPERVADLDNQPDSEHLDSHYDGGGVQHSHGQHPPPHLEGDVTHSLL